MFQIQTIIHKIEVGNGARYAKYAVLPLLFLTLFVAYDFRGAKNLSAPEAMDAAQLARNLADHKGFTTQIIRPFSIYLLKQKYADDNGPATLGDLTDRGQVKGPHPDLANPPLYPLVLAGLMKISPAFKYAPTTPKKIKIWHFRVSIWGLTAIYPPDFWIGIFNQFLFLILALMIFLITSRRFDRAVAWTSVIIFLGTDLFWRFSVSGLSTMLLMIIFLGLAWTLSLLEEKTRVAQFSPKRQLWLAALVGALVALGCLTRYSFGWLIIPVVLFLALFLGANRLLICVTAIAVFFAVLSPWLARNYSVSHTFFGTAGYAIYADTSDFPEYTLERSLHPELVHMHPLTKFLSHAENLFQEELPRLGGSWIGAFFLVGLLIGFQNPTLGRLRYFLLFCLPVLIIAQLLARTQLSDDLPVINSENLLVLVAPLVIVFGVSLFFTLLEQIQFPIVSLRFPVIGGFVLLLCLPVIITFSTVLNPFAPRGNSLAFPPYYPPLLQQIAVWMKPDELVMSDIPWAVAWYGKQPCLWLTLNSDSDFYEINDYQKNISAIYLSYNYADGRFLTQLVRGPAHHWGRFVYTHEIPVNFPLKKAYLPLLPDEFFLTDSDRWSKTTNIFTLPAPVFVGQPATNAPAPVPLAPASTNK